MLGLGVLLESSSVSKCHAGGTARARVKQNRELGEQAGMEIPGDREVSDFALPSPTDVFNWKDLSSVWCQ